MIIEGKGKLNVHPGGHISAGREKPDGTPEKLDYFNISKFPELVKMYGEKPTELIVMPPTDNMGEFFGDSYVAYGKKAGKKTKIRQCDTKECIHRIPEQIGDEKFEMGEISDCICERLGLFDNPKEELRRKACRYSMWAKLFVAAPKDGRIHSPLPYLFTSGENTAKSIHSALTTMSGLTSLMTGGEPKLAMLSFKLILKMVESATEAKKRFPVIEMVPIGSIADINQRLIKLAKVFGWDEDLQKQLQASAGAAPEAPALPAPQQEMTKYERLMPQALATTNVEELRKLELTRRELFATGELTEEQSEELLKTLKHQAGADGG
jgi:hypothetical protein